MSFRVQGLRRRGEATEAGDSGITLAGDSRVQSPAGAGQELPAAAEDTVRPEGHALVGSPRRDDHDVQAWLFRPSQEPAQVDLAELPVAVADDENFVWVDLAGYGEADLRELAPLLKLDAGALRAALAPWHRPRLAVYPTHFYVTATVPYPEPAAHRVEAAQLDLFVGNNFLVSAHKRPLPFADHLRHRAYHSPELVSLDAAFMLYLVLDELLAYYDELNRHVQDEIQRLEERALRDPSDAFLGDLLDFKRYAFALAQLADQHRDVFMAFLRPDFPWVAGRPVEEYYRDLQSRLARVLDMLMAAREAVNGAFDIYVSHMAHRTNQVIKVLTMVSTILLPATLILGLFGSSLASSVRGVPAATPLGFALMLLFMLAVSGAILAVFHRRGWL